MLCLSTEPAMGKGCVAREQCPMATAEAHASARTFLREEQDQFVQCKSHMCTSVIISHTYSHTSYGEVYCVTVQNEKKLLANVLGDTCESM